MGAGWHDALNWFCDNIIQIVFVKCFDSYKDKCLLPSRELLRFSLDNKYERSRIVAKFAINNDYYMRIAGIAGFPQIL